MTRFLTGMALGVALGYGLALYASAVEQVDAEEVERRTRPQSTDGFGRPFPNVVPPTPRERIAVGQVWRSAWPDYDDPQNAGA